MVEDPLCWNGLQQVSSQAQRHGRRRTMVSLEKLGLVRWALQGETIIDAHGNAHVVTLQGYVATFAGRELAVKLRLVKPARSNDL